MEEFLKLLQGMGALDALEVDGDELAVALGAQDANEAGWLVPEGTHVLLHVGDQKFLVHVEEVTGR